MNISGLPNIVKKSAANRRPVARNTLPNRSGWRHYISRVQGSPVRFELRDYAAPIAAIAALEHEVRELSDGDITRRPMVRIDRPDVVFAESRCERSRDCRRDPACACRRPSGPGGDVDRHRIGEAGRAAAGRRCCVRSAEREERCRGSSDRRRGWCARRGHDFHEHGRSWHRHPPRRRSRDGPRPREICRTLARYAVVVEEQHRRLMDWRRAVLTGEDPPRIWERSPDQHATLVAAVGEQAVLDAERTVTLACIDRAWRDHLALCADLREGIHLVRLGGQDPLMVFTSEAIQAFSRIEDGVEEAVLAALAKVRVVGSRVDLTSTGIKAPSATWTYLVNDDRFKSRIGAMLTGPGGVTIAIYSAAIVMPLLIVWGLVEKMARRRPRPSD